jgi:uncharacterized membrane protein
MAAEAGLSDALAHRQRRVALHLKQRKPITSSLESQVTAPNTRGQRAADAVAAFGGSWRFVGLFAAVLVVWIAVNVALLATQGSSFDPYPFILLNLVLSMLAAIQAPVILMAQNRQAEKDRERAGHDYEVNLKAELEILLLHDKLDQLRQGQWRDLLVLQQEQLRLLQALVAVRSTATSPIAPSVH